MTSDAPVSAEHLNALRTRLHEFGLGNWVGRFWTTAVYKLRVAEACVDALDQFDRYETEIERLRGCLKGISSCATCDVCREAAHATLIHADTRG
jgi:hypothetical protein